MINSFILRLILCSWTIIFYLIKFICFHWIIAYMFASQIILQLHFIMIVLDMYICFTEIFVYIIRFYNHRIFTIEQFVQIINSYYLWLDFAIIMAMCNFICIKTYKLIIINWWIYRQLNKFSRIPNITAFKKKIPNITVPFITFVGEISPFAKEWKSRVG